MPQIFSTPEWQKYALNVNTFYRCKNAMDRLYRFAKFGEACVGLVLGLPGVKKFDF